MALEIWRDIKFDDNSYVMAYPNGDTPSVRDTAYGRVRDSVYGRYSPQGRSMTFFPPYNERKKEDELERREKSPSVFPFNWFSRGAEGKNELHIL